jgi:hypothetical protein
VVVVLARGKQVERGVMNVESTGRNQFRRTPSLSATLPASLKFLEFLSRIAWFGSGTIVQGRVAGRLGIHAIADSVVPVLGSSGA